MTGVHSRRFSGAYSAFQQQRHFEQGWTSHDYLIELRKDALLARTIVIPDSYILDGRFFVATPPAALLGSIARAGVHPLEVRTRANSLEESLRTLLVVDDEEHLNPFFFNTITDENARHALARQLGRHTRDDLALYLERGTIPGMIALLRDTLASAGHEAEEDLDRLQTGWSHWVEAERQHVLRIQPWDAPMDMPAAIDDDLVSPDEELMTTIGRTVYQNLLASIRHGNTRRAREMLVLDEQRRNVVLSAEEQDLETLRLWYDQNRHRALARQHHCTAYVHGEDLGMSPIGELRRWVHRIAAGEVSGGEGEVGAPKEFLDTLGSMTPEAFAQLSLVHEADLQRWWDRGDRDALRRLIDGVMVRSPQWQQAVSRFKMLVEVFGAVVTSGAGIALGPQHPLVPLVPPAGVWLILRGKKFASGFATGRVVELLTAHTELNDGN